jgi:hypothetical protein
VEIKNEEKCMRTPEEVFAEFYNLVYKDPASRPCIKPSTDVSNSTYILPQFVFGEKPDCTDGEPVEVSSGWLVFEVYDENVYTNEFATWKGAFDYAFNKRLPVGGNRKH